MFYLLLALAVVLAVTAGIVATTLPGHRNVPGSAALLACRAGLLAAAGTVHLRDRRTVKHG